MNTPLLLVITAGILAAQPSSLPPVPKSPLIRPAEPVKTPPTSKPVIDTSIPAETEVRSNDNADTVLKQIQVEVGQATPAAPLPSWAGTYFQGDSTGLNTITIGMAPKAGAAYKWRGSRDIYGSGAGTVKEEKGWLTVKYTSQFGMAPDSTVFAPITWGNRRYLIGKGEMQKFCNAVNLGDEPREKPTGVFFLRPGDEDREVKGLPQVPAEFKDVLLSTPVTAKVTKVEALTEAIDGRWDSKSFKLTMDKGGAAGLKNGMAMSPTDPRAFYDFPISDSSADSCVVTYTWSSWQGPHMKKPEAGWTFSTKRTPVPKKAAEVTPK